MHDLTVVYAGENPPWTYDSSVFLVGPTSRIPGGPSWRPEALEALAEAGYRGVVFVPEPRDPNRAIWDQPGGWTSQTLWEERYLSWADAIMAWVPRIMPETPGLTTNFEIGEWLHSGKLVVGAPEDADSVRYLITRAEGVRAPTSRTLAGTAEAAVAMVGEPSERSGVDRSVPLHVWRTRSFQSWRHSQLQAGHFIESVSVRWVLGTFLAIVHAAVLVSGEDRVKRNEVVVMRPDIASVALLELGEDMTSTRVLLVREYRTPARNSRGSVWELPGGSGPGDTAIALALDELREESGMELPVSRVVDHGHRQLAATLSSHHGATFSAALSSEEAAALAADDGQHGADEGERITLHMVTIEQILGGDYVDWSTIGQILTAYTFHAERREAEAG